MKVAINKSKRGEKGQALAMVLILMAIGGLIIAPLLSYMSSGLTVEQKYEYIADEFYAADAGVADGLWQIKYNHLTSLWSSYDEYDYTTTYDYDDSYPLYSVVVNDIDVDVTIENVWIPKDITKPTAATAHLLIERDPSVNRPTLMITDNVPLELTHQIKIYYYQDASDPDLYVTKLGTWLPPGFSYDTDEACTLETWLNDNNKDYSRQITPHCGGEAVVWTFSNVLFTDLPQVNTGDDPMTSTITFKFTTTQPGRSLEALSWITTSGVSDIPYTWDADVKVYNITSTAGGEDGTIVDAYAIKSELRKLGGAIAGDYRAIGATLMIEGSGHGYNPYDIRYELLSSNDAEASDIPANAQVDAAYLYWSAWIEDPASTIIWTDPCSSFNAWIQVSRWTIYSSGGWPWGWGDKEFQGQGGGTDAQRTLAMSYSIDLSIYLGKTISVTWDQTTVGSLGPSDILYYAFYNGSWSENFVAFSGSSPAATFSTTVPAEYMTSNFKMRFFFSSTSSSKYVRIDNISITASEGVEADTSVIFKINDNQVYFANDEYGNPTVPTIDPTGSQKLPADKAKLLQNFTGSGEKNGYSYACYKDVTELLQAFSDKGDGDNRTGNGTYTVGDVYGDTGDQWSYAAWSLIIIYSSPETQGHQLYLFDDNLLIYSGMGDSSAPTNVDFDDDGQPGGTISGFLVPNPIEGEVNAAQITCFVGEGDECFGNQQDGPNDIDSLILNGYKLSNSASPENNVWNSKSPDLTQDGIDIDTFSITWESGILAPDASSANVDMLTGTDSWNLIYIILSFRSSTITGGTITYLLKG